MLRNNKVVSSTSITDDIPQIKEDDIETMNNDNNSNKLTEHQSISGWKQYIFNLLNSCNYLFGLIGSFLAVIISIFYMIINQGDKNSIIAFISTFFFS